VRAATGEAKRVSTRLPQELRLARSESLPAANRYLKSRFVPEYNARFALPAAEPVMEAT